MNEEIRDIIVSVLALALIFSYNIENPAKTFELFPYFLVIIVIAFLFHELAHRFLARKFGCVAYYKMWTAGILLGLISMLFLPYPRFVAPGAVIIFPFTFGRWGRKAVRLTTMEMGLISLSGIAVNIFFAVIFRPLSGTLIVQDIDFFALASSVNAALALFNLLPIPPLDGSKIFAWKLWLWFFLFAIAILLVVL